MSKKILALISVLALIVMLSPQTLVKAEINQAAVDYLKAQTPDPWITMALVAAGETGLDLTHLQTVEGTLATDYEKTILAIVAAGEDPSTFGDIDFVNKLKTDYYTDNQIGSADLLNDDIWGILALVAAGESTTSSIIQDSRNFLLANQNPDGGWAYNAGGDSDTNDTATAIMALLELGYTAGDEPIANAIEYLKNQQNSDGGFPYTAGSDSDSGSDSWVISAIYKLGQDPTSADWQNNGNNAVDHLKSLQKPDGSFKWIASDDTGYTSLTAFAVIALAENYYPIRTEASSNLFDLRIERSSGTICDTQVQGTTALDVVENAATICGYTYEIEDTGFGPYLKRINSDEAEGLTGWLYFVNYISPMIGAGDYVLEPGDQVLWYYGGWGWPPTRVSLDRAQIEIGENVNILAEYFNGSEWLFLPEANIVVGSDEYTAATDGRLTLNMTQGGLYQLYIEMDSYVRSKKVELMVGQGVGQTVNMIVEIIQPQPEIAFELSKTNLDFGTMAPGSTAADTINITNSGDVNIYLEGQVASDQLFIDNLKLNGSLWTEFSTNIDIGSNQDVEVQLAVPSDYTGLGVKTGDLTFWAIRAD